MRRRSETLPWSSRASHLSVRPTGQGSWSAGEHGQCPTASQSADRRAAPRCARAGDMGTRREIWRGSRSPGSRQRRRPMAVRRVSNISWSSPQGRSVGPAAVASLAMKEVSPILPMSPWSPQTAQGLAPLNPSKPAGREGGMGTPKASKGDPEAFLALEAVESASREETQIWRKKMGCCAAMARTGQDGGDDSCQRHGSPSDGGPTQQP